MCVYILLAEREREMIPHMHPFFCVYKQLQSGIHAAPSLSCCGLCWPAKLRPLWLLVQPSCPFTPASPACVLKWWRKWICKASALPVHSVIRCWECSKIAGFGGCTQEPLYVPWCQSSPARRNWVYGLAFPAPTWKCFTSQPVLWDGHWARSLALVSSFQIY